MKLMAGLVCAAVAAVGCGSPGLAQEPVEAQLKSVMMVNIEGLRTENIEKALSAFHVDGPGRKAAEASMRQLFPVTDFHYEVPQFKLIGTDGDYAFARVLQHTKLVGEPKVPVRGKNSTLDMLLIFRKSKEGAWKIWSSTILTSEVK